MQTHIEIAGRRVGPGERVYIISELSANHNQDFDEAARLLDAAHSAGADAVKLQTYTPDTITIDADTKPFRIGGGTLWDGRTLHDLYGEAYMPWDWQPRLKDRADDLGIQLFSTAYDDKAVEFLEAMDIPAHKVASFELVDTPLIERMAQSGVPLVISTGMGSREEIEDAVAAAKDGGCDEVALLKCTSAYPAPPASLNLRTIPDLIERFGVPVGLSDHTQGIAAPVTAVALGITLIEKHMTMSRQVPGPDAAFSLEPDEFRQMVEAVRFAEAALGNVHYGGTDSEGGTRTLRRSLFVVRDVKSGERFTRDNVRSIRPGHGLAPRHINTVLGARAPQDIPRGTPLSWDLVNGRTRVKREQALQ